MNRGEGGESRMEEGVELGGGKKSLIKWRKKNVHPMGGGEVFGRKGPFAMGEFCCYGN